jgi:hypothetical protein
MALALPTQHSAPSQPTLVGSTQHESDWLSIAEAAQRTGLSVRAWRFRCDDLRKRGLARYVSAKRGRPGWQINVQADARLADPETMRLGDLETDPLTASARPPVPASLDLSPYAAHHVARAQSRLAYVQRWHELCEQNPIARKRDLAQQVIAEAQRRRVDGTQPHVSPQRLSVSALKVSVRSLEAWDHAYRAHGFIGLIDKYGSTHDRVGAGEFDSTATRDPDAVDVFYELYHTQQKRTIQECHDLTLFDAERHGWKWPKSYGATVAWLNAYDDIAMTYLHRYGWQAYGHKFDEYIEQTYAGLCAGDLYVCDHHQLKAFCLDPERMGQRKKDGSPYVLRPWVTTIFDAATRRVVGWHLCVSPNSDSILRALRRAFTDFGVCRHIKIDNGKDFDSQILTGMTKKQLRQLKRALGSRWKELLRRERSKVGLNPVGWIGILPALGIEIIRAIKYNGRSKVVERFFRTLDLRFTRSLATYCATDPVQKPECLGEVLADASAVPTFDSLVQQLGAALGDYHATPHEGDGMLGRTPEQAWQQSDRLPAKVMHGALDLLLEVRGAYKVGANGVRVQIGGGTFGYGRDDATLKSWKGREVLVAIDQDDSSVAIILTPELETRRILCRVPQNERLSPLATIDDQREAIKALRRSQRDAKRAAASAPARMKSSARLASDIAQARRAQRDQLRATGTDGGTGPLLGSPQESGACPPSSAPIAVCRTGFEQASAQLKQLDVGPAFCGTGFPAGHGDQPVESQHSALSTQHCMDDDFSACDFADTVLRLPDPPDDDDDFPDLDTDEQLPPALAGPVMDDDDDEEDLL